MDGRLAPVFTIEALGEQAPGVIGAWLNADLQLRRAVSAFVMVAFNQAPVLDSNFTDLAGVLESMARDDEPQNYTDRAVFKHVARQIRAGIPGDLPDELRSILEVRINTANKYSLRSRAQGLIEACWPILEGRVTLTPVEFAEAVANNRNALVHNDEGRKRLLVRDEVALYLLMKAITVVAYAAITLRLDVDRHVVLVHMKRTLDRQTWRLGAEQFRTGGEQNARALHLTFRTDRPPNMEHPDKGACRPWPNTSELRKAPMKGVDCTFSTSQNGWTDDYHHGRPGPGGGAAPGVRFKAREPHEPQEGVLPGDPGRDLRRCGQEPRRHRVHARRGGNGVPGDGHVAGAVRMKLGQQILPRWVMPTVQAGRGQEASRLGRMYCREQGPQRSRILQRSSRGRHCALLKRTTPNVSGFTALHGS